MHPVLRLATLLAVVSPLASASLAHAENPHVNTQTFRPSPHARDMFATITSDMPEAWAWSANLWLSFGTNPLVFTDATGSAPDHEAIQTQLSAHATGSLALTDWLSLGLEIPLFLVNDGQDSGFVALEPIPSSGLGDIRVSAKLGIIRRAPGADGLGLGLELPVGLPTGMGNGFVSDGLSFVPALALDLRLGRLLVAVNLGARLRQSETLVLGTDLGTEAVFRVAAGFEAVRDTLTILGELNGSSHDFAESNNTWVEGLLGADLRLGKDGLKATLGVGHGFAAGYGSTGLRVVGRIGWEPPAVRDHDQDGLDDVVDRCPNAPEDKDGFEDEDGCPDLDDDRDGVADASDRCPREAEDQDGFEDQDGCPDADNDQDGVADASDGEGGRCKNDPEDKDGFQDEDGCPDPDNDGDGILDAADDCPADATNKCGVTMNTCEIVIDQTVYFEYDKDIIKPESFGILDAVGALLATHDMVKKVEIQGHTDSEGDDAYNGQLSQRRADAVKAYLGQKGIAAERLTSVGYGESKPIASNKNAAGRAKNRRVQFIIVDPPQVDCQK
ncbi:MAG: OmpA family protein [Myxococcota bacterium]